MMSRFNSSKNIVDAYHDKWSSLLDDGGKEEVELREELVHSFSDPKRRRRSTLDPYQNKSGEFILTIHSIMEKDMKEPGFGDSFSRFLEADSSTMHGDVKSGTINKGSSSKKADKAKTKNKSFTLGWKRRQSNKKK